MDDKQVFSAHVRIVFAILLCVPHRVASPSPFSYVTLISVLELNLGLRFEKRLPRVDCHFLHGQAPSVWHLVLANQLEVLRLSPLV